MCDIKQIREHYRPDRISTLFIGESAPSSGKFFYLGNTKLYRQMRIAFQAADSFLSEFRRNGYFLDDLVPFPVNNLLKGERKQCHEESINDLSTRIRSNLPQRIVVIGYGIEACVRQAADRAGFEGGIESVPFPNFPQDVQRFQDGMTRILHRGDRKN